MAKKTFSQDSNQNDPKEFKESFGSFGTTTNPGARNHLVELQTKIRQGVKHVELHLANTGKGGFGAQDVPDKYGFEQRRTIMQLAKLNKQSLSVHATFDVNSFSGLGQGGFDDTTRSNAIKEIDESLKFASETAKSGAVVFHIQGDQLPIVQDRSEINLSKKYLNWLKKNKPEEYKGIMKDYYDENNLNRKFVSNIDKEKDIRKEFENLKNLNPKKYSRYRDKSNLSSEKRDAWEIFYMEKNAEKRRFSPDAAPYILIGDNISQVDRSLEFVDLKMLKTGRGLTNNEVEILEKLDLHINNIDFDDTQKANAIFTNGIPTDLKNEISEKDYQKLKNKILINYDKIYEDENCSLAHADAQFQRVVLDDHIEKIELQKEDIEDTKLIHEENFNEILEINREEKEIAKEIKTAKKENDNRKLSILRKRLTGGVSIDDEEEFNSLTQKLENGTINQSEYQRIQEIQQVSRSKGISYRKAVLANEIGQAEYQKLDKYDEFISQMNEQKKKIIEQKENISSITDASFEKNTTAMGHLGIKALRYQLDLKKKSKIAKDKVKGFNEKIKDLEKQYDKTDSNSEKIKLADKLNRVKYEKRNWVGVKDYDDIDLINKPLYLAPENMLPGYGTITSIEDFKAVVRMSQQDFAEKILSNESEYKNLKEEYEKETGKKIKSSEDAVELAKRHIGGTFDNAHAAVWLKHFKKEDGESEEHRVDRFNNWLNTQAEEMVREGIVKHVHFNDTQGKDDDHNLLGQGLLDLHDLRHRLRRAGLKEALIVEAGGRGNDSNMHLFNAFDIFNPKIRNENYSLKSNSNSSSGVSDWIETNREYNRRPQYSQYGMGYSGFRHQPSQDGNKKGQWSGTNFL